MIFMPWVRAECEKPTAHKPCRGYLLLFRPSRLIRQLTDLRPGTPRLRRSAASGANGFGLLGTALGAVRRLHRLVRLNV